MPEKKTIGNAFAFLKGVIAKQIKTEELLQDDVIIASVRFLTPLPWFLLIPVFLGLWAQQALERVQYVFQHIRRRFRWLISRSSSKLPQISTPLWVIAWSRARARSTLSSCPSQSWPTATSSSLIPQDLTTHTNPMLISFEWWLIG